MVASTVQYRHPHLILGRPAYPSLSHVVWVDLTLHAHQQHITRIWPILFHFMATAIDSQVDRGHKGVQGGLVPKL